MIADPRVRADAPPLDDGPHAVEGRAGGARRLRAAALRRAGAGFEIGANPARETAGLRRLRARRVQRRAGSADALGRAALAGAVVRVKVVADTARAAGLSGLRAGRAERRAARVGPLGHASLESAFILIQVAADAA